MSDIAVVYTSKYGSAKQYAKWICEDTGADLFEVDSCTLADLADYSVVVYGGGVHAGGIEGIEFLKKNIKKLSGKKVIAFAVGINIFSEETQAQLREINFVKKMKDIPCWCFRGKYEPERVKGIDNKIMGFVKKMLSKKGDRTDEEEMLYKAITEGTDMIDRNEIKPLVDELKSL